MILKILAPRLLRFRVREEHWRDSVNDFRVALRAVAFILDRKMYGVKSSKSMQPADVTSSNGAHRRLAYSALRTFCPQPPPLLRKPPRWRHRPATQHRGKRCRDRLNHGPVGDSFINALKEEQVVSTSMTAIGLSPSWAREETNAPFAVLQRKPSVAKNARLSERMAQCGLYSTTMMATAAHLCVILDRTGEFSGHQ